MGDKEREEKESEEKARSAPRGPPPSATLVLPLRASPSPPSAGLPEEEVSRGSAPSSMTTAGRSSRASSKALSVTPSPTPSTPVTAMDVVYALKRQGRTIYGFGA